MVTVMACVRHGVDVGEVTFADLLPTAGGVELHDLHVERVVEVGDGRVVEREVPVLADAEAAEVERVRRGAAPRTAAHSAPVSAASPSM